MDEGWGALAILGIIIAIIVAIVWFVLTTLAWTFLILTVLFGNPLFVLAACAGVGAAIGMMQLRRRQGPYVGRSSYDYATIGSVRMSPEGWATAVIAGSLGLLLVYGGLIISTRIPLPNAAAASSSAP